jgi:restriction system protein
MSHYSIESHNRYTNNRNYYKKSKMLKQKDKFNLIILAVSAVGLALYVMGMPADELVQLMSIVLLMSAIVYVFYKLFWSIIKDARYLFRLKSRKLNADIDSMSGVEFEKFIAQILKSRGCKSVELTERYDLGVDVIAVKNGVTWGIQTKRYSGLVGIDAVRQSVSALNKYKCDRAMVITNSPAGFSRPAVELAKSNHCIMIGRKELAKWVKDFDSGRAGALA